MCVLVCVSVLHKRNTQYRQTYDICILKEQKQLAKQSHLSVNVAHLEICEHS